MRSLALFFVFAVWPLYAQCAGCDVVDDAGLHVRVNQPAKRIISLAPDITETLFTVGAGPLIVGVISGSNYPEEASHIQSVGSYTGLDLEKIIAIKPDLIVTWGDNFKRQLTVLKAIGIPVYISTPQHLEDVAHTMQNLGCLSGNARKAQQKARRFLQELAQLHSQYQHKKPVSVFYQIGDATLMTINQHSWINQAIAVCRGKNVFAHAKTITPEVSWEAVVLANPEAILNGAETDEWKTYWQKQKSIAAVANQALFTIQPDLINRAGPRLLKGTLVICQALDKLR